MKCTVTVVCTDQLAAGFELAGVDVVPVASAAQAWPELTRLLATRRWGLVVVSHEIFAALPSQAQNQLRESTAPLFVDLPMPFATPNDECDKRAKEYVSDLLVDVIGKRISA